MPQRDHKQSEAYAVPKKPNDAGDDCGRERWHRGADKKAEREIERSSNQPLQHHDLQRVRKRHLPR